MEYSIRNLRPDEIGVLDTFLYEAIFIPEGMDPPQRDIVELPELQVYIEGFGTSKGDCCLVAEVHGNIVGAVWARIMDDYGHIDNDTPSVAISLLKPYRHKGIGTDLMYHILAYMKEKGYDRVSLSVQKRNYAVRMYQKVGFGIADENDEEYIMVCNLADL